MSFDLKARFAGCLPGGAVGDAMVPPVEFLSYDGDPIRQAPSLGICLD